MIWNILQLIFCIILFVLPLTLYKSHRSFMVRFYDAMIHSVKARKLYVRVVLIFAIALPLCLHQRTCWRVRYFSFNRCLCHYIFI